MSGNQALAYDAGIGGTPDLSITTHGSDFYWAICAVMGLTSVIFMGLSFRKPRQERTFHYLSAGILFVAFIAYYSMAANLGQTGIQVEFPRGTTGNANNAGAQSTGTREIFYARYIDWVITTPLLLLDILLTAGLPWPTILSALLADEIMVVTGLLGALTRSQMKWGYWTIGMFAMFFIFYVVVGPGRTYAKAINPNVSKSYNIIGPSLMFLWLLYPIAWGVAEGGNVIHPDSEAVFYGILDFLAKPVWSVILIWSHRNITAAELGLRFNDPGEPRYGGLSGHHNEKHNGHHTNGNGTTGAHPPLDGPLNV